MRGVARRASGTRARARSTSVEAGEQRRGQAVRRVGQGEHEAVPAVPRPHREERGMQPHDLPALRFVRCACSLIMLDVRLRDPRLLGHQFCWLCGGKYTVCHSVFFSWRIS